MLGTGNPTGNGACHCDVYKSTPSARAPAQKEAGGLRDERVPRWPLTQLHVWQLRDVPHDEQEVGAESPVGVEQQEAERPVTPVSVLHAVLRGRVETPLLGTESES